MSFIQTYNDKRKQKHRPNLVERIRLNQQQQFEDEDQDDDDNDVEMNNNVQQTNTNDDHRQCDNCRRTGQVLSQMHCESSPFLRRFVIMKNPDTHRHNPIRDFTLCQDCITVFRDNNIQRIAWPACVWDILSDNDVEVKKTMWRIIPAEWKIWWMQAMSEFSAVTDVLHDDAMSRDVTDVRDICRKTFNKSALPGVSWCTFRDTLEKYLCIPCVRCPYGCSEYLHKACTVEFDVVLQQYIKRKIKNYTTIKQKKFDYGFRSDLFDEPCYILEGGPDGIDNMNDNNDENWFRCMPSIEMIDGEPFFLVCRFHKELSKLQYFHPPRMPSGNVSFWEDNNFAQVVATPRTLRSFRHRKHTSSYHIGRLKGCYEGIDCTSLRSMCVPSDSNEFSEVRKDLAIMSRSQCLNFDNKNGFQYLSTIDRERASTTWTSESIENMKISFGKGSTFMAIDHIVEMHRHIKDEGKRTVLVRKEDDTYVERSYVAPWLRCVNDLVDYGSDTGKPYPIMSQIRSQSSHMNFKHMKMKMKFAFVNAVNMVPEYWQVIESSVERNDTWHGWLLLYISSSLYGITCASTPSTNPFGKRPFGNRVKSMSQSNRFQDVFDQTFFSEWDEDEEDEYCNMYSFLEKGTLGMEDTVRVLLWNETNEELIERCDDRFKIVMLVNQCNKALSALHLEGYEIRFIACVGDEETGGRIYARRRYCTKFWMYDNKRSIDWRAVDIDNPNQRIFVNCSWSFCIFVKTEDIQIDKISELLLRLHGGQSTIRCGIHNVPLVIVPRGNHKTCCEADCRCDKHMKCPTVGCNVGLCKNHTELYLSDGNDHSVGRLFLSPTEQNIGMKVERLTRDQTTGKWCRSNASTDNRYNVIDATDGINTENNDEEFVIADDESHILNVSSDKEDMNDEDASWDEENTSNEDDDLSFDSSVEDLMTYEPELNDDIFEDSSDGSLYEDEDDESELSMDDYISNDDDDTNNAIPTTEVGHGTRRFVFSGYDNYDEIPNFGLLNITGNCLLRRHHKMKGTKHQQHFLQRLQATSMGSVCPLLQPEGMLFPSYFWTATDNGCIPGAIPCCCLMDDKTNRRMRVASLYDHARTRITDPTLPMSTSVAVQGFYWDMVANLGLRGTMVDVVLRRGFDDCIKNEGIRVNTDSPICYDGEQIDSRTTVNQLASASARKKADFFFTWTMNGTKTPGVRVLTGWIRDSAYIERVISRCQHHVPTFDVDDREWVAQQIEEANGSYVLRLWYEFSELFLSYLQYGQDSPFRNVCGGIRHVFDRSEIQSQIHDGKGPHHHTIIMLKDDAEDEELNHVLYLIRCGRKSFMSLQERNEMIEKGFVGSEDDLIDMLDFADVVLKHKCSNRCQILTTVRDQDGIATCKKERVCKHSDFTKINPDPTHHTMKPIDVHYEEETLRVMEKIGLINQRNADDEDGMLMFDPVPQYKHKLVFQRHCPPASSGVMSATNPFLFAMLLASMNLQFVTAFVLAAYLAKYIGSIDKASRINFNTVHGYSNDVIEVTPKEGYNTKITSNAIEQERLQNEKQRGRQPVESRAVSLAEMFRHFLQYKSILTDFKFVSIPTGPMESRPVIKTKSAIGNLADQQNTAIDPDARVPSDIDSDKIFANQMARNNMTGLSMCRLFDQFQIRTYVDQLFQPNRPDKITLFSLRPPELNFVRHVALYFIWFELKPIEEFRRAKNPIKQSTLLYNPNEQEQCFLNIHFEKCCWVDAFGNNVRIRRSALTKAYKECNRDMSAYKAARSLLTKLLALCEESNRSEEEQQLCDRFVCEMEIEDSADLPVYVFSPIRSLTNPDRFLYHVLLSMGQFTSELELLSSGSLKAAYQKAGLFTYSPDTSIQEESINVLCCLYFVTQLSTFSLSTYAMSKELVSVYRTLISFLMTNRIENTDIPSALYTQLRDETTEQVEHALSTQRNHLANSIINHLRPFFGDQLPSLAAVIGATPKKPFADFNPTKLQFSASVDREAVTEHRKGYSQIKTAIEHYQKGSRYRPVSQCITGAGGVGKTVDLRVGCLLAMCCGLEVVMTTLNGKRAAELCGQHLHVRFKLRPSQLPLSEQAELAYKRLLKDPAAIAMLERMDVMAIDELGQIGGHIMSLLDMIMRKVRRNSHYMGGVLVLSTMDVVQIMPIEGIPALFTAACFTSFQFIEYVVPLRTTDSNHRRVQEITRMIKAQLAQEGRREEFAALLRNEAHFVDGVDDPILPQSKNLVFCFPRHYQCVEVEQHILKRMKERYPNQPISHAIDFEETRTQVVPMRASPYAIRQLNQHVKPSEELYFHPYASFEVVQNEKSGRFFTHQLCILLPEDVPSQSHVDEWKPIKLYRAPDGVDAFPDIPLDDKVKETLLNDGWKIIHVGKYKTDKINCKGTIAFREQYALRHRICYTLHAIMGATIKYLVTRVDTINDFWDAAMVVVLLSRTKSLKDIYFIGDPETTIDALWYCLTNASQFTDMMKTTLKSLIVGSEVPVHIPQYEGLQYNSLRAVLPKYDGSYHVYLIASVNDPTITYIGSTRNLRDRLRQHNSRYKPSPSVVRLDKSAFRPWNYLAVIIGFEDKITAMQFEGIWKSERQTVRNKNLGVLDANGIIAIGRHLYDSKNLSNKGLRFVQCAEVSNRK